MNRLRRWSTGVGVACMLLTAPGFSQAQAPAAAKEGTKKGAKVAPASAVDLNRASAAELQSVPGIGAPTAKRIIAGRPYSSVADLSKSGLSAKQIAGISSMVMVGSMPAAAAPKPMTPVTKMSTPAAAPAATPAPMPAPAAKAARTPASQAATGTPAPGGGPGMVWANTETKVFHRQGDKFYGTTKRGRYMSEADAVKAGFRESKAKVK